MFDHLRKNLKNSIFFTFRGVAQLVARDVWERVTGSEFNRERKRQKALCLLTFPHFQAKQKAPQKEA